MFIVSEVIITKFGRSLASISVVPQLSCFGMATTTLGQRWYDSMRVTYKWSYAGLPGHGIEIWDADDSHLILTVSAYDVIYSSTW